LSGLTTHILDTAHGRPAGGVTIRLYACGGDKGDALIRETQSNEDGRCAAPLLAEHAMKVGTYRLEFDVAAYFRSLGVDLPAPPFLDVVSISFGIAEPGRSYHVPLLISPYGYSTYRGS